MEQDFGRQHRVQISRLHVKAMPNSWEGFKKELQDQTRTQSAAICRGTSGTWQTELVVGKSRQQLESNVWCKPGWGRADKQLARSTGWVLDGKNKQTDK